MAKTAFYINKEKLEVRISRVINAPRVKIWQAHTDPKIIVQWWGPRKYQTVVDKLDAKVGGEWKFINRADGKIHVFYGKFQEIREPEHIALTFIYQPFPDQVVIETLSLGELPDGKTKMTTRSKYPSLTALEGMIGEGMEKGAHETWDRLAELVEQK